MTMDKFIKTISDEQGPMQGVAAETMEHMSRADFAELIADAQQLLARGEQYHPTNKDCE